MRRAWKSVQGRGRPGRRSPPALEEPAPHPRSNSRTNSSSPRSWNPYSSLFDFNCHRNVVTTSTTSHSLSPWSPPQCDTHVSPQCDTHVSPQSEAPSTLKPLSPTARHRMMEQPGSRFYASQGVRFCAVFSRDVQVSGFFAKGFTAAVGGLLAVRFFHASFAAAAGVASEELDLSTIVSEDAVILPSVAGLEPVDMTNPTLGALQEELTEEPGALSHVTDLDEKLRCLRDWGLTDEDLAKLRLHLPSSVRSALLKNSAKKLIEVAWFLVEECGMPKMKVANALVGNVFLASSSIEECLRPKVQYLQSLGITKEQMGKIIDRCPQILTYSIEQRVLPMERKLIEFGLKVEDIGRVVMKYPGLLGTGINKIDRTVEFLKAAGVVEIAKCISRHPQILSLSLDGKVHDMTAFLKSDLLLPAEQINKTISIQPSILTYSVGSNLRPKVVYFQKLGLEKQDIGRMIALHPAIMGHSLETAIKPKIDYLVNVMNREVSEIVSFPQYLSYSLCRRIQPRNEYLAERGIFISLSSMLSCRPEVFQKRYGSNYVSPGTLLLASKLKVKSPSLK